MPPEFLSVTARKLGSPWALWVLFKRMTGRVLNNIYFVFLD